MCWKEIVFLCKYFSVLFTLLFTYFILRAPLKVMVVLNLKTGLSAHYFFYMYSISGVQILIFTESIQHSTCQSIFH